MLVLTLKPISRCQREIAIVLPDGREVVIHVVRVDRNKVSLAFMADRDIVIIRRPLESTTCPKP